MSEQKVLVLDIETSPLKVYVWDLRDQNVGLNQIVKDWSVIAWAAKWLGDKSSAVIYHDLRNTKGLDSDTPINDKAILEPLWKLLDEADLVITQNGARFDGPRLNARFMLHGMQPPSPYRHMDTYQIVKRVASFTSNKLEYLTDKLCTKYKKLQHKKFPGMSLWNQCLKGNKEAWHEMEVYNIHDVLSTEELYLKVRAWAPLSVPAVYHGEGKCRVCGSSDLQRRGIFRTRMFVVERLFCKGCGSWSQGAKSKAA